MSSGEEALKRIKKLLALGLCPGASDQEKETAMRRARALMQEHGVSQGEASGVETVDEKIRGREPTLAQCMLADVIAKYFSCDCIFLKSRFHRGAVRFFGEDGRASVCAYSFVFLHRLMEKYTAAAVRRYRKNRPAARVAFQRGWVRGLRNVLRSNADLDDEQLARAQAATQEAVAGMKMIEPSKELSTKKVNSSLQTDGWIKGTNASLPKAGLGGGNSPKQLTAI